MKQAKEKAPLEAATSKSANNKKTMQGENTMKQTKMQSQNERQLLELIRESSNPGKALEIALTMICYALEHSENPLSEEWDVVLAEQGL